MGRGKLRSWQALLLFALIVALISSLRAEKKAPPAVKAVAKDLLSMVKAPPGFDVTVFAAPPDVSYPTCLCAAPDGTLFVGVDLNGSLGKKPDHGRIIRCVDSKGSGKADKFNLFTKVDTPRGLWWDHNTLYVLHPPFLTAVYDDDGDGVADRSEVLVSGLGCLDLKTRGGDHCTNGFRLGADGWFYIAVGDYGAIKAQGKDGNTLQLRGGGILRVRPDGSGLELVCDGTRNIYDVAASPLLDLFTRDNTNDGGGWDVRLAHNVMTGHFGYPSLFVNFPAEIIQPLADYGGGAPCGALFLDEPGFPQGFGTALYTCDWGRSMVYRHPMTPNGSTFKVEAQNFVGIARPTDIDADGAGRLFISSWLDGGFDFSKPDVGFVACVTPKDHKAAAFPDLKKADAAALLRHLASPSQVLRTYTQREILRRGAKANVAEGLEKLAGSHESSAVRVAALFTLKQLLGARSHDTLLMLVKQDSMREYALRALADNKKELEGVPLQPFLDGLKDPNARVRLQAVIGLSRLGKIDAATALLETTTDTDPIVAHVAVNALVTLRAADTCLKALDGAEASRLAPGALRALQSLHETAVVEGLIGRLEKTTDAKLRQGLLTALARLYQREAEWDGRWWGTRPDTTGPYFKPVTWDESKKIADVLRAALVKADSETLRWLLPDLLRHRVEFPEVTATLLKRATDDAGFRRLAVTVFGERNAPPDQVIALFARVAAAADEDAAVRTKALRALQRLSAKPEAMDALLSALTSKAKLPGELEQAYGEFVRDARHVKNVDYFAKLSLDADPARRELAYAVLATIAGRPLGAKEARAEAERVLETAWKSADSAVPLLHAISRLQLSTFAPEVRRLLDAKDPHIAAAAKGAAAVLKIDPTAVNQPLIATLKYEEVLARAAKEKGDVALGGRLFAQRGCVNCHTVAKNEPLKGPFLGGIATRYSKAELIESILKPSAKLAQGFETHVFDLKNGKTITGFVVREAGSEIELRDQEGTRVVLKKSDIEERKQSKVSVMPEKLADTLTTQELASLLAYLGSLKAN